MVRRRFHVLGGRILWMFVEPWLSFYCPVFDRGDRNSWAGLARDCLLVVVAFVGGSCIRFDFM